MGRPFSQCEGLLRLGIKTETCAKKRRKMSKGHGTRSLYRKERAVERVDSEVVDGHKSQIRKNKESS